MPAIPLPPWGPQRLPPENHQPGNPLYSGPNMHPPAWNPGGLLPGPSVVSGPLAWATTESQNFRSDGTNQVWTFQTPLFDCRPGLSAAYGIVPAAVPIAHDGALGLNIYLTLIVGTRTGAPPALVAGMEAAYWEEGSALNALSLVSLTKVIDITAQLQAGGDQVAAPRGASPFSFTPCVPGCRLWKLNFRLTIPGVAPITAPLFVEAALH